MASLRILHINSARTWRGGEQQTLWLCEGLQQRGHEIHLACPPASTLQQRAEAVGISVTPVTMRGEWDVRAIKNLIDVIWQYQINVVHFHTAHAHTLGLLAAQFTKTSVRILTRRVDFHIHRHLFNRWKYGSALTTIIAISNGIRQVLIEDGIDHFRVTTVHSGINLQRIKHVKDSTYLYDELGISPDSLVIGIVAALAPHKHHQNFLDAAVIIKKFLPKASFLIVGDGELRNELEQQAKSLNLFPNVIFTGFRQDVLELIQLFDIFVLSSYLEGMGTSILDAMALGKPVVATAVGGIPEIVKPDQNGLLVPPRHPDALAQAILILAEDRKLRQRMGAIGTEYVQHFSVEKTVEQTEKIYHQAIQKRSSSPCA